MTTTRNRVAVLHGVNFDILGGASVGAAVLGGFAMLLSPEEVDGCAHDVFVTSRSFKRLTFPRYALLDHVAFDEALRRQFGGTDRVVGLRGIRQHQHQVVGFAFRHHRAHQFQRVGREAEVMEAGGEARHAQDAHRVLAKGFGDMPQNLALQVLLAAVWIDHRTPKTMDPR